MHQTAHSILSLFRKVGGELSTSKILENIDEGYKEIYSKSIKKPDIAAKRQVAKKHRKILHHLNSLVNLGIMQVSKHGAKGEKYFTLGIAEGEELLEFAPKYKKRVIVSRPAMPSVPIEGYEQGGIVKRFDPANWIDRLDSVLVFGKRFSSLENLYGFITSNVFPVMNDSVIVEDFEHHLSRGLKDFLTRIGEECRDFNKVINLVINPMDAGKAALSELLEAIPEADLDNIKFIFSTDKAGMVKHSSFFLKLIAVFAGSNIDLYIRNNRRNLSPNYVGRAGPYSTLPEEWTLTEHLRDSMTCMASSQSSVIVDVQNFFNEHGMDIPRFTQLMVNICRSLLTANSLQRQKSADSFRSILTTFSKNPGHRSEFLSVARNYIRFWNFGLNQENIDIDSVLHMINEAKKKINEFAAAEETIYKSCGMTTRFKIALAPAFAESGELSEAKYERLEIPEAGSIYKKNVHKKLKAREATGMVFNGGDEVTLHYVGTLDDQGVLDHIQYLLTNYNLPLFNLKFTKMKGDLKLTHFFDGNSGERS